MSQVLTKLKWGMEYKGTLKCAHISNSKTASNS